MVKAYLRYEFSGAFGVITSGANPCYDISGRLLITSTLESISVWNVKQGNMVRRAVTYTCARVWPMPCKAEKRPGLAS